MMQIFDLHAQNYNIGHYLGQTSFRGHVLTIDFDTIVEITIFHELMKLGTITVFSL